MTELNGKKLPGIICTVLSLLLLSTPLLASFGCATSDTNDKNAKTESPEQKAEHAQEEKTGDIADETPWRLSGEEFRPENIQASLTEAELDMVLARYYVYERPNDGVLVLTDGLDQFPIAESWRLFEFEKADWVDAKAANQIFVIASYATGIGPTGARPFRAKIIMTKASDGWSASEPEMLAQLDTESEIDLRPLPERPPSKFDTPFKKTITTPEDFAKFIENGAQRLSDLSIDFDTQRLVTARIALTSGSNMVEKLRVHKDTNGYDLTYEIKRPRIGTADIKISLIYAIIPADGFDVDVFERGDRRPEGAKIDAKTGILNRL